jgi:hypothetical protein
MRAAIITIIAAVAVALAVFLLNSRPGPATAPGGAQRTPVQFPVPASQSGDAPRRPMQNLPDANVPPSYNAQFLDARDLWPFAEAMHRLALEGDDAAQFWLYRAMNQCGEFYDRAFDGDPAPGPQLLALDEAVQRERRKPWMGAAYLEKLYAQCARMRTAEAQKFGDAETWLDQATTGGYPQAQIWTAGKLQYDTRNERPGTPQQLAQARALTYAALRSGDPEVVLLTESVATSFVQGESARERHKWVWIIAGCMRGAECGPNAEWLIWSCADGTRCQSHESGLDIIRKLTGAQFEELEEEARELNDRISRQKWDELGF